MAYARKAADTEFKKEFNVTFKQAQTYIQGDKKRQIYKEQRQIARSLKTDIEKKWKADAVDRWMQIFFCLNTYIYTNLRSPLIESSNTNNI